MNAVLHQGLKVGAFVMVGMNATVTREIPNFALSFGSPSKTVGVNRVRLLRLGVPRDDVDSANDYLLGLTEVLPSSVLNLLR